MQRFGTKKHLNSRTPVSEKPESTDNKSIEDILQGCKEGSRQAQEALFKSLSAKMYAVCLRYMSNRDDASDVLQEGFVTLFGKLDDYSGKGSFEGWARKIFVNTALQHLRRNDALKMSGDLEEARSLSSDAPSQIQQLSHEELIAMVASLPPNYRTVFNMTMEGYSHREIAQELGINEVTSRSYLQRARAMLQEKIKRT